MNQNAIAALQAELARKRREILALPPEKALDRILSDPQPAALVHSMEEQDFYFLLHDIGVEDALELLGLAAVRQWEYILDAEIWSGDRIDVEAATRWFHLMLRAAPRQLVWWAVEEQTELVEYFIHKTVQVVIRENDQDASDIGDGFVSFDDSFFFRPMDAGGGTGHPEDPTGDSGNETSKQIREAFTVEFLKRIAAHDHIAYQNMLLESTSVLPAEMEEELFRLRNVRLAEKGFMPFHEAVGIYQPPSSLEGTGFRKKHPHSGEADIRLPVPVTPSAMIAPGSLFSEALAVIDSDAVLTAIQEEFAGLCNQVVSADRKQIRDRKDLAEMVRKVCGYLSIGMETKLDDSTGAAGRCAAMIQAYPLASLFRIGYGRVLKLKWDAEKWRRESWAEAMGLPLGFWGETWVGTLGGVLIQRPLYFDNFAEGTLYRDFRTLAEIEDTRRVFEEIAAMDRLFANLNVTIPPERRPELSWKNLLLTLWARYRLTGDTVLKTIPVATFGPFFRSLWKIRGNDRIIGNAAKESLLEWFTERTGWPAADLSAVYGEILESLFAEVEAEYGDVTETNLDPRFMHLFLLS